MHPWERIVVPVELDGAMGENRAPRPSCPLRANTNYEASATRRAYRGEAERLMLWAVVERGVALSTEDAMAYRAFLHHPAPRARWIVPAAPRSSPLWRPFTGGLSPRSTAYALPVLGRSSAGSSTGARCRRRRVAACSQQGRQGRSGGAAGAFFIWPQFSQGLEAPRKTGRFTTKKFAGNDKQRSGNIPSQGNT